MTESIVLLNEIKYVLSQNCEGTNKRNSLNRYSGLTIEEICCKLYRYKQEDIERLLKLETQTFEYNNKNLHWIMFPEIVDVVKRQIEERKSRMHKLYNEKHLSRFISYDSYKEILLYRKDDFDLILDRCEKLAACNSEKIHLPSGEIWDMIIYTSNREFSERLNVLKTIEIKNSAWFGIWMRTIRAIKCMSSISCELTKIENRLDNLEAKIIQNKNQSYKIEFADFVIKSYVFKCNENHDIEQIQAQIDIMSSDGNIITETVSAGYCRNCKCYFILEADFNLLRSKGIVLCQQITYEVYRKQGSIIVDGNELKPESLLHQCGYNVSSTEGLTSVQRQEILCRVVDNGLYSISGICSHLDWLITRNKKITNRDMSTAISKWQEDRKFISKYNSSTQRRIGVSSINKTNYN